MTPPPLSSTAVEILASVAGKPETVRERVLTRAGYRPADPGAGAAAPW